MRFSSAALSFLLTTTVATTSTALTAESGHLLSQRRALVEERVRALGHSVKRHVVVRLDGDGRALQEDEGDACEAARNDLNASGDLTTTRSDLDTALSNAIDRECTIPDNLEVGDTINCVVDENDQAAETEAHSDACTAAGGEVYELDFRVMCVISSGDDRITFTLGFVNGDFCDATACETSQILEDAEELTAILDDFEAELESIGGPNDGVNVACDTGTIIRNPEDEEIYREDLDSGATIGARSLVAVTAAVLATAFVGVVA